jgi:hypothetical protein
MVSLNVLELRGRVERDNRRGAGVLALESTILLRWVLRYGWAEDRGYPLIAGIFSTPAQRQGGIREREIWLLLVLAYLALC